MESLITILWEQMSSSKSAQTHSEVWEDRPKQGKLAAPLPPPPATGRMQEVGWPCTQIFAVVSLADLMIEILTDNGPCFCWVIVKFFHYKVDRAIEPSHLSIYLKWELQRPGTAASTLSAEITYTGFCFSITAYWSLTELTCTNGKLITLIFELFLLKE